jgi:hypothetical protein
LIDRDDTLQVYGYDLAAFQSTRSRSIETVAIYRDRQTKIFQSTRSITIDRDAVQRLLVVSGAISIHSIDRDQPIEILRKGVATIASGISIHSTDQRLRHFAHNGPHLNDQDQAFSRPPQQQVISTHSIDLDRDLLRKLVVGPRGRAPKNPF